MKQRQLRASGNESREALRLAAVALACAVLAWLASRLPSSPAGLVPCWLACGAMVGPAVRWPRTWALPALGVATLAGLWAGGAASGVAVATCAVTVAQAWAAGWGLRSALPMWFADRRPTYRVRIAHLTRFVFMITLPSSLGGGVLAGAVQLIAGESVPTSLAIGQYHAAASGISIAVIAPLMWWKTLRAVQWPFVAVIVAAACGVPVLATARGELFWFAPAVVIAAGYFGSTWLAVLAVACTCGSTLALGAWTPLAIFDGPNGFVLWLLATWRLLGAGLIASLWSERRAGLATRGGRSAAVHATPAHALSSYRKQPWPQGRWMVFLLDQVAQTELPPEGLVMAAGTSLSTRSALCRLASRLRAGDHLIGMEGRSALLLLQLREQPAPAPDSIGHRLRAEQAGSLRVSYTGTVSPEVAILLLHSAAHFAQATAENADEGASRMRELALGSLPRWAQGH